MLSCDPNSYDDLIRHIQAFCLAKYPDRKVDAVSIEFTSGKPLSFPIPLLIVPAASLPIVVVPVPQPVQPAMPEIIPPVVAQLLGNGNGGSCPSSIFRGFTEEELAVLEVVRIAGVMGGKEIAAALKRPHDTALKGIIRTLLKLEALRFEPGVGYRIDTPSQRRPRDGRAAQVEYDDDDDDDGPAVHPHNDG